MPGKTTTDNQVHKYKQRRRRLWRAKFGVEPKVFFAPVHSPGRHVTAIDSGKRCMALSTGLVFDYSDTMRGLGYCPSRFDSAYPIKLH